MKRCLSSFLFVCSLTVASFSAVAQGARIVASAPAAPEQRGEILRERVDPCLGLRWQWIANPAHPEWPYHLVLVDASAAVGSALAIPPKRPDLPVVVQSARPERIIRAGDLILVHQQTGTVSARLQGLALDSAAQGRPLRVRLTVSGDRSLGISSLLGSTGPVITVTAQAPGEALWALTPVLAQVEEQSR